MQRTMEAAVVRQFGQPLSIEEVEVPRPARGEVLVKIAASGVCHTDLHAAHGDWPVKPNPPFIPGHEGVGQVAAVGEGVTHIKEGDRVGIPWLYTACGHCEHCLGGWETLCESQQNTGYSVNGGFARVRDRRCWLRRSSAGQCGLCRDCSRAVCRGDGVQGAEDDRYPPGAMGGGVGDWRTGPYGGAVCQGHGAECGSR